MWEFVQVRAENLPKILVALTIYFVIQCAIQMCLLEELYCAYKQYIFAWYHYAQSRIMSATQTLVYTMQYFLAWRIGVLVLN